MIVKHTVELNTEDVVNILSSARTGISYWAARIEADTEDYERAKKMASAGTSEEDIWADILFYGKDLIIYYYDQDGDEDTCTDELTLDKIKNGVNLVLDNNQWNGNDNTLDASVADCIIQYALFDEIIYG